MNREEIEVEAEKYGIENYESCIYNDVKGWETDIKVREQSFKDGAEFVYEEIAKLKEEIAKLKEDVEYWKNEYYYLKANPKKDCFDNREKALENEEEPTKTLDSILSLFDSSKQ